MGKKGILQLSRMKSWSSERNQSGEIALKKNKTKPSKVEKKKIGWRNKQKEERHLAVREKGEMDLFGHLRRLRRLK